MTPKVYKVYARRLSEYDKAFGEFVEVLCKDDRVIDVLLTGSRARGDALPYSDYDVIVVIPDNSDKLSLVEELRRLRRRSFPLDLIAIHESELRDPLYSEMLRNSMKLCNKKHTP